MNKENVTSCVHSHQHGTALCVIILLTVCAFLLFNFCGYNATVFHASGSQMGPLAWSDQNKCKTGGRGKYYRVCQEYGRANSCDKGGATTCVCGVNCE